MNKSTGHNDISFNIVRKCLRKPLKCIAKVIPLFKASDTADLSNYGPKSVLPYFSKMLEPILHNRLYQHLLNQKIFYPNKLISKSWF